MVNPEIRQQNNDIDSKDNFGQQEKIAEKEDGQVVDSIDSYLESSRKQNEEECRRSERDLVIKNSEYVGINFDQDFIVNSKNLWSLERFLKYAQERDGQISKEVLAAIDSGRVQEILSEKNRGEFAKKTALSEYLRGFNDSLKHVRINPAGDLSPIAPAQAIEVGSEGSFEVSIAPEFIDQIKEIREITGDITVVVPFYNHRRGKEKSSDIPETSEQIDQYIAICEKLIESVGADVQLEIGNETNVSRNTAVMFADKLQHASHVNSEEYAKFYFEVAKKVKEKNPTTRLSIAGVACFDPTYLKEVLTVVKELQKADKIDDTLVDSINFHPYRQDPVKGSIEVKNGNFIVNQLNYEQQMEEMQKIASEFGVKLTVGEINFPFSDPEQQVKLEQAVSSTANKGIESLIYPGINV